MTATACRRELTILRYTLINLCFFTSSSAWAFADPLQNVNPILLVGLLIGAIVVILWLSVTLLVSKRKIAKNQALLSQQQQETQRVQEQIDRFIGGVVQLNSNGQIVYVNRMAAYFLRRKADDMMAQSFVDIVPDEIQSSAQQALEHNNERTLECAMGPHARHCRIRISPQQNPIGDITTFIEIDEVDHYQQQIDKQRSLMEHRDQSIDHAQVCLGSIHFEQQTILANRHLSQLLGREPDTPMSFDEFNSLLESANSQLWDRFITQLKAGERQNIESHIRVNDIKMPVNLYAFPHGEKGEFLSATLVIENRAEQEKLKQQNALAHKKNQALISASPLPIYILNQDDHLIDCNRAFCALFKVDLSRVKNKRISDIECFDENFIALHANKSTVGTKRQQAVIIIEDNASIDINLHLLAIQQGNERIGTVAVVEDLSPLKQLENQYQDTKEALDDLIQNSPLGIALFDEEDQLQQVNSALTELLGISPKEREEHSFYQLFKNPEDSGTASRLLHKNGHIKNLKVDLMQANEQSINARLDVSKLSMASTSYVCWVTDAREQQYLSHQLQHLINYSKMPIAILGHDGFTQVNPAACAFFDVKSDDALIGLSPASKSLNESPERAQQIADHLAKLHESKQVSEFSWCHQHEGESLPCEITLVPLFEQSEHTATLCMWVDLRAIEQANAARLEAVNLRQTAEREVAEKQELLQSSQDMLASRARSLQDTQQKLLAAESDLATKLDTISNLQKAHEDISGHLQSLQDDYDRNRDLLTKSQESNAALEEQLEQSGAQVASLQKQRNQIADALQYTERNYKKAQQQLSESEQTTQRLKEEQASQQESLAASQAKIDALKNSISDKDKQISDVSGQINNLQSQLASSSQASDKLREQLINQRKASEQAEIQRRELELTYQKAQAELGNKASRVEHLQHEMNMLEQMSQQQKGDMEKQTQALAEELKAKQQQLESTENALSEAQQQSEQVKQQNLAREAQLENLQNELAEVEKRNAQQQQTIADADAKWQQQQDALQAELLAKQQALQDAHDQLDSAQQQTEEEKAQQAKRLTQLQSELNDVEQRAAEQNAKIAQSEQQWHAQQQAMADELAAKKAQLASTQEQLDEHQRQVDQEKLARETQQNKLEQLKQEMADVESRANKQREMMAGSDEQWRQHHAEIEQQKQQLQEALAQAQLQNEAMQSTLQQKLDALKVAESEVSKTHSDEEKLQVELNAAKQQADQLQTRLADHESQEQKLKQQVEQQQQSLIQREENIDALQKEQQRLTEALAAVKQEYAQSKASLSDQNSSQQALTEQLNTLEQQLSDSKQQLQDKESALQEAQKHIASSEDKLAEQEQALIDAQKVELKQANEQQATAAPIEKPEFAKLPMPEEPAVWFDLLPYLQHKQGVTSLANTLQALMDALTEQIEAIDTAIAEDNERDIQLSTRKLIRTLGSMHSNPLTDMADRLQMFCENRLTDNISIYWPSAKTNVMNSLRVIYSHLHAENEE